MRNFFKRNLPIFIIGILIIVLFLIAIFLHAQKQNFGLNLKKVGITLPESTAIANETSSSSIAKDYSANTTKPTITNSDDTSGESTASIDVNPRLNPVTVKPEDIKKIDSSLVLTFYDDNGFIPRESRASLGEVIEWVNKSSSEIVIREKTVKFDEFKVGVHILPGDSFKFRIYKEGLWAYEDINSKKLGYMLIGK